MEPSVQSSLLSHADEEVFCLPKSLQEAKHEELWVDAVKSSFSFVL